MSTISESASIKPGGAKFHLPLPRSKRLWVILIAGVPLFVMIVMGLAQIFRFDLAPFPSGQQTMPDLEWRDMISVLNRYGERPAASNEQPSLDILLATPQYFSAIRRQVPETAKSEPSLLFYVIETTHIDDLPAEPPEPTLRIGDSMTLSPTETLVMADSYHHRSTLVRYSLNDLQDSIVLEDGAVLEMVFPAVEGKESLENTVRWTLPLQYSDDYSSSEVALGRPNSALPMPDVTGVAVLAILGGLLAAMWPCLFQLTAYFIPAMAGMSMQEASETKGMRPRMGVVKTALFFVVGFTVVYTLAGAVIGYGSQQLSNLDSFYVWQRYLSIGAGVILFVLAFRVAARARAPLVCKMPIASRMAHKGVTTPWESMVVGITFATGCMTCFGSAVLIGMVLYVGLAGSPVVGATLLFLFSLGMGIPLVIGAIAMARILPLLFKMEKVIPWMGLTSATIIAGYAVLLITGNSMGLSSWFYRLLGMSSPLS